VGRDDASVAAEQGLQRSALRGAEGEVDGEAILAVVAGGRAGNGLATDDPAQEVLEGAGVDGAAKAKGVGPPSLPPRAVALLRVVVVAAVLVVWTTWPAFSPVMML
jgi:hypothetical protein